MSVALVSLVVRASLWAALNGLSPQVAVQPQIAVPSLFPWQTSVEVPVDRYLRWEPTAAVKALHAPRLNDCNAVQLEAAHACGISEALQTRDEAETVTMLLEEIVSNPIYMVDTLTYSVPYLTHDAARLVNTIGERFAERVQARGLGHYRMIVTSVLRTREDVLNLRASGNRNAVLNSTHCFATTFDLSYERFYRVGWFEDADPAELTAILADVVEELRARGDCYAIFERRETCIHITSRH